MFPSSQMPLRFVRGRLQSLLGDNIWWLSLFTGLTWAPVSLLTKKKNMSWMSHCFRWPLTSSALFVLAPAETSCGRGADAATGPRCQPDSDDAGHHGPGSVLLQRQTDDGEGPGPARALKGRFTALIETKEEPAGRGSDVATRLRHRRCLPGLNLSHLTVIFWDPFHHGRRFRGWNKSFLYFPVVQTLTGRVFRGQLAQGFWVGLVSWTGLGGQKPGLTISRYKSTC